jgi:hypothetical protein
MDVVDIQIGFTNAKTNVILDFALNVDMKIDISISE